MTNEPKYYLKVMDTDRRTPYAKVPGYYGVDKIWVNTRPYQLPQRKWLPKQAPLELCSTGYHFCRDMHDLARWVQDGRGQELWVVKVRGARLDAGISQRGKACAEEMILVRKLDIPVQADARFSFDPWGHGGYFWSQGGKIVQRDESTANWYTMVNLARLAFEKDGFHGPRNIKRTSFYKYMQSILAAQGLETWGDN